MAVSNIFLRSQKVRYSRVMGVRRLFFQGGQEHTFCLKSTKKHTIFLKKVQKHTIFGRPWSARERGKSPLAPPSGRPCVHFNVTQEIKTVILNKNLTEFETRQVEFGKQVLLRKNCSRHSKGPFDRLLLVLTLTPFFTFPN